MDRRTTTRQPSTTWASWSETESNYYRSVRTSSIVVPVVSAVIVLVFAIAFICILYYIKRRQVFERYQRPRYTSSYAEADDTASTTVWSSSGTTDMQLDRVMQDLPPPYPGEDLPPAYSVACNMINYDSSFKDDIGREQPKDDINDMSFYNSNPTSLSSYIDQTSYHTSDPSLYVSNSTTHNTGSPRLELDQAPRSRSSESAGLQSFTDDACSQHSSVGSADCQHSTNSYHPYDQESTAGSVDCQHSTGYHHSYDQESTAGAVDCQHPTGYHHSYDQESTAGSVDYQYPTGCHHPCDQESTDERYTSDLTENTTCSTFDQPNNSHSAPDQQTPVDSDSLPDMSENVHGTNESDYHSTQQITDNNSGVYFV